MIVMFANVGVSVEKAALLWRLFNASFSPSSPCNSLSWEWPSETSQWRVSTVYVSVWV